MKIGIAGRKMPPRRSWRNHRQLVKAGVAMPPLGKKSRQYHDVKRSRRYDHEPRALIQDVAGRLLASRVRRSKMLVIAFESQMDAGM